MPNITFLTSGLGGVGHSYATVEDLDNISLPRGGSQATIDSNILPPAPYNLMGKTLIIQVTEDGITSPPYTFTFLSNYSTLDQVVAAVNIPSVLSRNNSGKFRLQTVKYGYEEGLHLDHLSTANAILGLDTLVDMDQRGISSLTKKFSGDEKAYQLAVASAMADSYLRRRYITPITGWDLDLVEAICDIAAFKLLFREGFSPDEKNYDQNFKNRHDKAIKWLSDVGNRMIHPNITAGHKAIPRTGPQYGDLLSTDPRGWSYGMSICNPGGCGIGYNHGEWDGIH